MSISDSKLVFLFSGIIFLISTDLSVILSIPLLQQVLGFLFLAVFPGFLIVNLIHPDDATILEKAIYSVGLSISFSILFGLFLNILLPTLGNNQPLSTISILAAFTIADLFLLFAGYMLNNYKGIRIERFSLTLSEKLLLIDLCIILLLSILGTYMMNVYEMNYILLILFLIIPVITVIILFHKQISPRLYPVAIFFIGLSVVLLFALRSNHLLGVDVHDEFYFFTSTLNSAKWIVYPNYLLSGTLSISLLPTVFEKVININTELLFKILYPLLYSITPLIVFVVARKYLQDSYAFIAACFFIFQYIFLKTSANTRTSIAIIFVALSLLVLFSRGMNPTRKGILLTVFFASMILSHYTTSYIFFSIILAVFVCEWVLSKVNSRIRFDNPVKFSTVLIFFSIMLLWYKFTGSKILDSAINFVVFRNQILLDLLGNDLVKYSLNTIRYQGYLISLANITEYFSYLLIGLGVLWLLARYARLFIRRSEYKESVHQPRRITVTHVLVASFSFGFLVLIFFTPFVFFLYDTGRIQPILFITLSGFLVIGCIFVVESLHRVAQMRKGRSSTASGQAGTGEEQSWNKYSTQIKAILSVILVIQFLSVTGVIYQASGYPRAIILNSPVDSQTLDIGQMYVFDSDASAARWLRSNMVSQDARIFADPTGIKKMTSQTGLSSMLYAESFIEPGVPIRSTDYLILLYSNRISGQLFSFNEPPKNISLDHAPFQGKSKVFDDGAEIFK